MPTLIERLGSRILRSGVGDALLREERDRLQQAAQLMQAAYAYGPWVRPPDVVAKELQELDPWVLSDVLSRVGWDVVGMLEGDAQRQRSVQESRRLYHHSPIAQWAIWLWTSWGMGEAVFVRLSDPTAQEYWDEFFTADRNQSMLGADRFHELSHWLLIDGNTFLTFHVSTLDGATTLGEVPPDEIQEIITHPGSAKRPLFYKRVNMVDPVVSGRLELREVYYPDYAAVMSGELDEDNGSGQTLAQMVLPRDAYRMDLRGRMEDEPWRDATLNNDAEQTPTTVSILHIHHNHKDRSSLWGWPLLSTDAAWVKAHREFVEARLAVARSKAQFVRRKQVLGGSRAVDSVRAMIASTLGQDQYYDTNPPPPPGSVEVENRAIDTVDLPMSTGAADARSDNALFAWHALLGAGLFPASAGLDLQRYATALAMDKSQSMLWTRYQSFWAAQIERIVRVVVWYKEQYQTDVEGAAEAVDEEYTIDVSVDTFSLSDFPDVSTAIGRVASQMLAPMAESGVPPDTIKRLWAALWLPMLQSLGVSDAIELTAEDAFGIEQEGNALTRALGIEPGEGEQPGVAPLPTEGAVGPAATTERIVEGGPGSGHYAHKGIPGSRGGSLPANAVSVASWYRPPPVDDAMVEQLEDMGPWEANAAADELGKGYEFRDFQRANERWTMQAEQSAKDDIDYYLKNDPSVRTLTLYDTWSSDVTGAATAGEDYPGFKEWLDQPQVLWRGGGRSYPFMSFSTSKRAALDASKAPSAWPLVAKPREWLGSGMTGAGEVYVDEGAVSNIPMGESASGPAVATERMIEMIRESAAGGEVDWHQLADNALGMLTDWAGDSPFGEGGPGSGHHKHRGIPHYHGGSMASGAIRFSDSPYESQHISAYCRGESERWVANLSTREREAVTGYTSGQYDTYNNCARRGDCKGPGVGVYNHDTQRYDYVDTAEAVEALDWAISESLVPEETIVYRGVRAGRLATIQKEAKNGIYQDDGFMSTTVNPRMAADWDEGVMEIRVPKGMQGAYVFKISEHPREAELLLQRGTQLRFTGTKLVDFGDASGPRTVGMFDVVGQADPESLGMYESALGEAQGVRKDAGNRFLWDDDDLVLIDEEDILPVGKRPRRTPIAEGGPGSGHHGHEGIPGHQGGSRASGSVRFGPVGKKEDGHIRSYAMKHSEKWLAGLGDSDDVQGVYAYSGVEKIGRIMNFCAREGVHCGMEAMILDEREGRGWTDTTNGAMVRAFDRALDQARVPQDTVVYRGVETQFLEQMMEGDVFQDQGFMSTTLNPQFAARWHFGSVLQINVPKGARAGYVQKAAWHPEDVELVFQRGTQLRFSKWTEIDVGEASLMRVPVFDVVGQPGAPEVQNLAGTLEAAARDLDDEERREYWERFEWREGELVQITDDDIVPIEYDEDELEEGGPGSGHHKHRGIPGYHGGSMRGGPISFLPRDATYSFGDESKQKHIEAYCKLNSSAWQERISPDEHAALSSWGSSQGNRAINGCLRHDDCSPYPSCDGAYPSGHKPHHRYMTPAQAANDVQSALSKQRVAEDTIVYRAVSPKRLRTMQEGAKFQDDGFVSTTLNPAVAGNWRGGHEAVIELRVPKGTHGGYMQNMALYDNEVELLLQRGTQFSFSGQTKVMQIPNTMGGWRERTVYVFDVVGHADLPMKVTEAARLFTEGPGDEEDERNVRPERFAWEDDDWFSITDDDVVPIEYDEDELEEGGPGSGNWGHKGRPGLWGGSAPRSAGFSRSQVNPDFWTKGPGAKMTRNLNPQLAAHVREAYSAKGISYHHLENLKGIYDAPGYGYSMAPGQAYFKSQSGVTVLGVYYPKACVIRMPPKLSPVTAKKTAVHELGHHIEDLFGAKTRNRMKDSHEKMRAKKLKWTTLESYGLRQYSMTNWSEFVADSFKVYIYGTENQQRKLAKAIGVESLSDIFQDFQRTPFGAAKVTFGEDDLGEGGPGSGHHGHRGRPKVHGGSLPGAAGRSTPFTTAAVGGHITSSGYLGGGICDSKVLHYKDDGTGVWKETDPTNYTGVWGHDGNSEVAAYRLNQLMGGNEVPQTVYAVDDQGRKGTSQQFISDTEGGHYRSQVDTAKIDKSQIDRIVALDIITGNGDRHEGNFLFKGDRVIAIDHGHAHWGKWEDGAWATEKSALLHRWLIGKKVHSNLPSGCDIHVDFDGFSGNASGRYKFDGAFIKQLQGITKADFDKAMAGVSQERHVNLDNAWHNLQFIAREGQVEW